MNASIIADMLASATNPTYITVTDSLLIALIGIVLVFVVLAVLMLIIWLTGYIFQHSENFAEKHPSAVVKFEKFKNGFKRKNNGEAATGNAAASAAEESRPAQKEFAAGTCGELTLIKTDERDAAMIMAIIADATKTPLNQLRFKSIKRLDEGDKK